MKNHVFVFWLFGILLTHAAIAHQPRIVAGNRLPQTNPMVIHNPEVSQVFYGELTGEPDYYTIPSHYFVAHPTASKGGQHTVGGFSLTNKCRRRAK
jgi:hypothetical protein